MANIPKFKLDPCFACKKHFDITDINNINSCCSETASAFAGQSSLNAIIETDAGDNCKKCLDEAKQALGKDNCVLRLTNSPVWTQAPHYFPYLFSQSGNKDKALSECYDACKNGRYSKDCMNKCLIDYDAVITTENFQGSSAKSAGSSQYELLLSEEKEKADELLNLSAQNANKITVEGFKFLCDGDKCKSGTIKWFVIVPVIILIIATIYVFLRK